MAFSIAITGEDNLSDAEKAAFERHLVEEVQAFINRLKVRPNVSVSAASVEVDTLDPVVYKAEKD